MLSEKWDWRNGRGQLKNFAALSLLEKLLLQNNIVAHENGVGGSSICPPDWGLCIWLIDGFTPPPSLDRADQEGYEPRDDARARIRIVIERTHAGWTALPLPGGEPIPADLNLEVSYESSTSLFKAIR